MPVQQKGLIQLLPLLIIAAIVVLALYILFFSSNRIFSLLGITELTRAQAVLDTEPPSTPTNLKVYVILSSGPSTLDNHNDLKWDASTDNVGIAGYEVYRSDGKTASVTATSYTDTNLSYATDYTYYVKAKDTAGNLSAPSSTAHMMGVWGDVLEASNSRYIKSLKVDCSSNGVNVTTYTNVRGEYVCNLAAGIYTVTFSKTGYITQTFTETVVDNKMTTRNVFMRKGK